MKERESHEISYKMDAQTFAMFWSRCSLDIVIVSK